MKYLVVFILVFSFNSLATVPAAQVALTKKNMKNLGFRVEARKLRNDISATMYAPPKIGQGWELVGTQSYSYVGDKAGFLSKVGIENPSSETEIYVSYDSSVSDGFIGAYYKCVEVSNTNCPHVGAERIYFIESLNGYVK